MSTESIEKALRQLGRTRVADVGATATTLEAARQELATMKQALRDLRELAVDGPSEVKGAPGGESYWDWKQRISAETAWVKEMPK